MSVFEKGSWKAAVQNGPENWDPLGECVRLLMIHRLPDRTRRIVTGFTFEVLPEYSATNEYPVYGDEHDHEDLVRAIMNAAWEAGIRPDGYNDTRRETEALKAHLNDFRHLVFKRNPFGADS